MTPSSELTKSWDLDEVIPKDPDKHYRWTYSKRPPKGWKRVSEKPRKRRKESPKPTKTPAKRKGKR